MHDLSAPITESSLLLIAFHYLFVTFHCFVIPFRSFSSLPSLPSLPWQPAYSFEKVGNQCFFIAFHFVSLVLIAVHFFFFFFFCLPFICFFSVYFLFNSFVHILKTSVKSARKIQERCKKKLWWLSYIWRHLNFHPSEKTRKQRVIEVLAKNNFINDKMTGRLLKMWIAEDI